MTRLAPVWAMALEMWSGEVAARRFMFDAHPLLHDRRPIDVVLGDELGLSIRKRHFGAPAIRLRLVTAPILDPVL